jgi:hypothetical protein
MINMQRVTVSLESRRFRRTLSPTCLFSMRRWMPKAIPKKRLTTWSDICSVLASTRTYGMLHLYLVHNPFRACSQLNKVFVGATIRKERHVITDNTHSVPSFPAITSTKRGQRCFSA